MGVGPVDVDGRTMRSEVRVSARDDRSGDE